jgi:hypothetical protein
MAFRWHSNQIEPVDQITAFAFALCDFCCEMTVSVSKSLWIQCCDQQRNGWAAIKIVP